MIYSTEQVIPIKVDTSDSNVGVISMSGSLSSSSSSLVTQEISDISSQVSEQNWTMFSDTYPTGEIVWGVLLLISILGVNSSVLFVVSRSRELWKPRHLWMACLCVTDLFVGAHKCLELLLLMWPQRELCVLQRATLGIPYVVNMLLLTLLSLDRFVAVRYPFYYSATISNRHVSTVSTDD